MERTKRERQREQAKRERANAAKWRAVRRFMRDGLSTEDAIIAAREYCANGGK